MTPWKARLSHQQEGKANCGIFVDGGDLPAAGAISRLSSVVRALSCPPVLLSLISTDLGL